MLAALAGADLQAQDDTEVNSSAVDVAVFYTPAAREHLGGTAETEAEIDLMIAATNQALSDSGADVELALAGTQLVRYEEEGYYIDYGWLVARNDGHMDGIHRARDRMGADIVVLLSRSEGACGIAWTSVTEERSFALVRAGCSTAAFAHEVAHLFGVEHDRYVCRFRCSGKRSTYSHGYVNQRAFGPSAPESSRWRTIMAYRSQCTDAGFTCPEIMRYSNSDQTHLGDPLGVPGTEWTLAAQGPVDAVRTITDTRELVASFRARPEIADPPEVSIAATSSPVTEGAAAEFEVTLSAAVRGALTVSVSVTETGSMLSGTPAAAVTISGGRTSATLRAPTVADEDVEADSTVTATVTAGTGYTVGSNSSASVTVEDDDAPPVVPLTASFVSLPEAHAGSGTVELRVGFSEPISTSYRSLRDQSFQVTNGGVLVARRVERRSDLWDIVVTPSSDAALVVLLPPTSNCEAAGAVCTADGKPLSNLLQATIPGGAEPELPVVSIVAASSRVSEGEMAQFVLSRTGPTMEELTVQVSTRTSKMSTPSQIPMRISAGQKSLTPSAGVHDNKVVEDDVTLTWTIVEGEGYAVSADSAAAVVVLEENDAAEFSLAVDAAEVAEGESTTARVAITNGVTFSADQTITLDFAGSTATRGTDFTVAPSSRRTLQAGQISVTALIVAGGDTEEEDDETVVITAAHGGTTVGTASVAIVDADTEPLTAEFVGMPETHDGETAFTFELRFSEEIRISYVTLRDTAFEVTGGAVTRARRLARPSNRRWEITVEPGSDGNISIVLPVTIDCAVAGAVCTAGGKPLSNRLAATVAGPEPAGEGFRLAPENGRPSGIWSDGATAWVADVDDATLYAYRLADGSRQPERDMTTGPEPMGLWSDGATLWVAGFAGGLWAHRLADGSRLEGRDLALEANAAPVGLWSDGATAWVAEWLGDTVHAYRLSDGRRTAGRDIELAAGNLLPLGVWSDGVTLWVADWQERMYAYRLSNGERMPERDIPAGGRDEDPSGLWSGGGTLLSTSWGGGEVRAYPLPAAVSGDGGANVPAIADPALRAGVAAALGKAPGEAVGAAELAELETLSVRDRGVRDLTGLEGARGLRELDLGFNPLADLWPLADLHALESLNLDGTSADLHALASLTGLRRLSLRHAGLEDPGPLAGLASLTELDVGGNRIRDLHALTQLTRLEVLRSDRNRIADLSPLRRAVGLRELDLGFNPLADLWPLASLPALKLLNLDGTGTNLPALASLTRVERLSLRHNDIHDLWPLAGLASLTELDVGDNRIEDLHPLTGLTRLAVLRADRNRIADLWPLASLAGLEGLDLTVNLVRDVHALTGSRRLRTLHLGGNGLTDVYPLSGLEGLVELSLAGNAVGDVSNLAGLRRLDLRGNDAGTGGPLGLLPSLAWVHVGGSRMDLSLPAGLDGLAVVGWDDRESPGGGIDLSLLRQRAEQGEASAQAELAWRYEEGRGVGRDYGASAAWFRRAADQGHAPAQAALGYLYATGRGVGRDGEAAVTWSRLAAEQGNARAQYNLGVVYANGRGVPRDEERAVRWFRRAAEQSDDDGQYGLGVMYEGGRGVRRDRVEAARWYRLAAEQGHVEARKRLDGLR